MNKNADYYSEVGSYRGLIKMGDKWFSVIHLNYIDKSRLTRWQGPPTSNMINALKQTPQPAVQFLPHLKIVQCPFCKAGFPIKEIT